MVRVPALRLLILAAIPLLVLFLSAMAPPALGKESCVSSQCHSRLGTEKYVHGPVAVGECTVCHKPNDPSTMYDGKRHKFEMQAQGADLCYTCHDRLDTQKEVHAPVTQGLCIFCHDPHQGANKFQLKAKPASQLCYGCHERNKDNQKEVHGPVAVGDCVACHNPHSSPYQFRLVEEGNKLCFVCHSEMKTVMEGSRYTHPPAQMGCGLCHDPHTSPLPQRLKVDLPDLCLACHVAQKEHIAAAKVKHDAYVVDRKCLNCHNPHAAEYPKQLLAAPMDLCLKCHDKELTTPTGKIMDIKGWLANNKIWHGPVKQKDCSACHNPHGSDNFRILRKYYPPVFYTSFTAEKYELCFTCHERTLVLDERTTSLTGFRNGDVNLHFKHVNKEDKGRTCRSCHEVHASNNPKRVRDSVPFGKWKLPVNFVKNETGGQCSPGCHVPRRYDRKSPAENR